MIPVVVTAALGVVGGLLLGGCTNSSNEISKSLMARNAQLENQLTSTQLTLTGVAITAVILACGLGASIYHSAREGGKRGTRTRETKTGK